MQVSQERDGEKTAKRYYDQNKSLFCMEITNEKEKNKISYYSRTKNT